MLGGLDSSTMSASGSFGRRSAMLQSPTFHTIDKSDPMTTVTQLRPHHRSMLRWVCALSAMLSGFSPNATWAQDPAAASAVAAQPVVPETPEFKAASQALREHIKETREIMVRFNTTPVNVPQDRQLREQWFAMMSQGEPLFQQMMATAVAEYQLSPNPTSPLAGMLWETFKRRADVDMYEGMLPVGQALLASGYDEPELQSMVVRTAYALNELDIVRQQATQLASKDATNPQAERLLQDLAEFEKLWAAELAAREQDAQGPPLPRVRIQTTKGNIEVELFENQAPETVANFISLVESGFYEGLIFHRVMEHFMAQTGCPVGDGSGDPGYKIYGEFDKPNARMFYRGTLGMALSRDPNSGGSQFFITFLPTPELNGKYTAFGRVVEGIEVLGHLVRVDPESKDEIKKKPIDPLDEIISMEVLTKRAHEYIPHKVK